MYAVSIFLVFIFVASALGQNCKTSGEWCSDTELCCGGCCIRNSCVDMNYDDCTVYEEPCLDEYCPADSVCKLFKPRCMGCDMERKCIFIDQSNVQFNMNPGYDMQSSSDVQIKIQIKYFFLGLVLLTYFF